MATRITTPIALATHLGWDQAEMSELRYQPTRNKQAIYVIGEGYMTASPVGKKPKEFTDYQWKKVDSWITEKYNWEIFEAVPVEG